MAVWYFEWDILSQQNAVWRATVDIISLKNDASYENEFVILHESMSQMAGLASV